MKNYLIKTFKNKTILVTGHTGFKGSWLTAWLQSIGANITGVSLNPKTQPSHFSEAQISKNIKDIRIDIRHKEKISNLINDIKPDFIFHLAAQAIVKDSYSEPVLTWETNVIGSLNILESLKKLEKKCTVIMVTSDKCYENVEWVWGYKENDKLGGSDPYSASKAAIEIGISAFVRSFFYNDKNIRVVSARAGNVIGGGDWSNNRIVPDIIKAWSNDDQAILRNPDSTRPWQHVLEPLSGYLNLAAMLNEDFNLNGQSFNFGPSDLVSYTVEDLTKKMSHYWNNKKWQSTREINPDHESRLLKLNCDKALSLLKWNSVLNFDETVKFTTDWYKKYYHKKELARDITDRQIEDFTNLAANRNLIWAQ